MLVRSDVGEIMKVAKIVGGGCLGLIVLLGLIIGVVFYATSGITDTADNFFAAVEDGDYEAAQGLTSQRLQQQTSAEELRVFVEDNGFSNVADTSWSSRSIENNTGEVSGTVETESGGTIPMTILFVSEGDEWRIDGFDVGASGLSGGQSRRPDKAASGGQATVSGQAASLRIEPEALAISNSGILPSHMWLNEAWIEGDYLMFTTLWKDRPSPQSLAARYPSDGLSQEDINALDRTAPDVEIAEFDDQGRLVVGYVRKIPGRSIRTVFTFENVEGEERPWKIVDLEIDKGGA